MWFPKNNHITRIVYVWFAQHFACRRKKCFLSISLWYMYVYLITFNSDVSANSLLRFLIFCMTFKSTRSMSFWKQTIVYQHLSKWKQHPCLDANQTLQSEWPLQFQQTISPPIPFLKTSLPQSNNLNIHFPWHTQTPFISFQECVTVEERNVQLMS